jgi:hypothetical protein
MSTMNAWALPADPKEEKVMSHKQNPYASGETIPSQNPGAASTAATPKRPWHQPNLRHHQIPAETLYGYNRGGDRYSNS